MSLISTIWTGFVSAINTEYDRRIRAASNVRAYHVGGHDHHGPAAHDHADLHDQAHDDHGVQATQAISAARHDAEDDASH
ncbi:MAG TPA: hypothetical protein VGE07_15920 [Herpetosiphonaceae bacterium]